MNFLKKSITKVYSVIGTSFRNQFLTITRQKTKNIVFSQERNFLARMKPVYQKVYWISVIVRRVCFHSQTNKISYFFAGRTNNLLAQFLGAYDKYFRKSTHCYFFAKFSFCRQYCQTIRNRNE